MNPNEQDANTTRIREAGLEGKEMTREHDEYSSRLYYEDFLGQRERADKLEAALAKLQAQHEAELAHANSLEGRECREDGCKNLAQLCDGHAEVKRDAAVAETLLLRKLVTDCQSDLATWIVPDSGISDHAVLNTLLGRLDGPQSCRALAPRTDMVCVERDIETADVLADYLERLGKAATSGPWMWGPLIEGQGGDFVVWKHRGLKEAEFPGPQREFVGNVGHFIQPVVMASDAGQLFDGEKADSELIVAMRNNLRHIIAALRMLAAEADKEGKA